MKGVWLGQAGFLLTADNGTTVMIDPYLSNHLEEELGSAYHREVPADSRFLHAPDILIVTHDHADHMDFETLDCLFAENKRMSVLCPESVLSPMRKRYGTKAEWILFRPDTEVTLNGIWFHALFAAHSDPAAIGVELECGGRRVCHLGDTLYHRRLLTMLSGMPDLLILPINGKGNNMNAVDAARLTRVLLPKAVLPMHWDLFRAFGCNVETFTQQFAGQNSIAVLVPQHFCEFDI